jgi:toxin ParE1/3/4
LLERLPDIVQSDGARTMQDGTTCRCGSARLSGKHTLVQVAVWRRQGLAYAKTFSSTVSALGAVPSIMGVTERNDIAHGLFTLHVAYQGHEGRHVVQFQIARDNGQNVIDVLRILHSAMNLSRHLPSDEES